ncbi:hypothetical protein TNCT_115811 [Trichonephila clavata]|uniref:Uncharacterized protein n=1 Tax=Trichonephila clavata TaxID=2740835 RepID=A0A8X6H7N5_TRICU|nr:hypothetical protein TNCT_115811 [Trichonephila clavata]
MRISKQYSKVELSVEESGDEKKFSPNIAATAETAVNYEIEIINLFLYYCVLIWNFPIHLWFEIDTNGNT